MLILSSAQNSYDADALWVVKCFRYMSEKPGPKQQIVIAPTYLVHRCGLPIENNTLTRVKFWQFTA